MVIRHYNLILVIKNKKYISLMATHFNLLHSNATAVDKNFMIGFLYKCNNFVIILYY